MSTTPGLLPLPQRVPLDIQQWKALKKALSYSIRVEMPGIIQSFDATTGLASIQLAVRESPRIGGVPTPTDCNLNSVPVMMPHGGGLAITWPLVQGDEVVVVFSDSDFATWWETGQVSNPAHPFRHGFDVNRSFAYPGPWSKPNFPAAFSMSSIQLRTADGTTVLDIAGGQVNVQGGNLVVGNGATGTFTSAEGKVITVANGIVVGIE